MDRVDVVLEAGRGRGGMATPVTIVPEHRNWLQTKVIEFAILIRCAIGTSISFVRLLTNHCAGALYGPIITKVI